MVQRGSFCLAFTLTPAGVSSLSMNYAAHYDRLIALARSRVLPHPRQIGSVERHHALPKCMGGRETKANMVELTPREHFVAHLLLAKANPTNGKLAIAAFLMSKVPGHRLGSRAYAQLKTAHALAVSSHLLGWKHTPEMRAKVSAAHRGKVYGPETRARIAAARRGTKMPPRSAEYRAAVSQRSKGNKHGLGRKHTDEAKAAISRGNSGKKRSAEFCKAHSARLKSLPPMKCPHCSLVGSPYNMKRWHFDNCKKRSN